MKRSALILVPLAIFAAVVSIGFVVREQDVDIQSLAARMKTVTDIPPDAIDIPCRELAERHPLVLLALGQSNAGNHGTLAAHRDETVALVTDDRCVLAHDPLPGATGSGGSIWPRLAKLLGQSRPDLPIVVSVLAVDASTIAEWTEPHSPLRDALLARVTALRQLGLSPSLILWQQGESDGNQGTSRERYFARLALLSNALTLAGSDAPIVVALSTRCRGLPAVPIRDAVTAIVAHDRRFRLGPDTDTLSGTLLRNGCHFTADGLVGAAHLWEQALRAELPVPGSVRN